MKSPGLSILGAGCVTALGRDWQTVWRKIRARETPTPETMPGPDGLAPVSVFRTPLPEAPPAIAARLRRSGAISYFACAAAQDAVQQAGVLPPGRTALIFAASDGAVTYTRRFFEEVVDRGAGSPLLFPETVYNAPASHVATMLGLDGAVLTLVGDATAGLDAIATASDLLNSGGADCCVVVSAEELDWVSCEGYRLWGLAGKNSAAHLTEGAVALVVGRPDAGAARIVQIHPGRTLRRGASAVDGIQSVVREFIGGTKPDLAVVSASGAKPGEVEERVLGQVVPTARIFSPKKVAGEGFAASTLLQCLCAWQEIHEGNARTALVTVVGWSGQTGALLFHSPGETV